MDKQFYSSSEAAEITRCTRRQLQYWRHKGVVVPQVNPGGKGRNVYYSESDLMALAVMEYFLGVGLSFEVSHSILSILQERESWLFQESLKQKKLPRFMILIDSQKQALKLVSFNSTKATEQINQGVTVVPFWSDRIFEQLQLRLASFAGLRNQSDDSSLF